MISDLGCRSELSPAVKTTGEAGSVDMRPDALVSPSLSPAGDFRLRCDVDREIVNENQTIAWMERGIR